MSNISRNFFDRVRESKRTVLQVLKLFGILLGLFKFLYQLVTFNHSYSLLNLFLVTLVQFWGLYHFRTFLVTLATLVTFGQSLKVIFSLVQMFTNEAPNNAISHSI